MTDQRMSLFVWGELALLALIWGGSFLAIRTALDEIPVLASVTHRVFWAALILWGVVALRRLPIPRNPRIWGAFLVMGCLNNVIPFSLMAWGQLTIETGLTAILNAATAIWGVLVAAAVFKDERLSWMRTSGVLVGFAGVAIAVGVKNLLSFDPRSLAQIAVIAGTLSYAFAGSWARATLSSQPPLVAAAGMLTGSTFVMIPLTLFVEGSIPVNLAPVTWVAIAYYAIAATALAYLLYYRILASSGAGNLLLVTLLIPPVAIILGRAVLNEAIPVEAYLGFALLALGLALIDGRLFARLKRND
ncbi:MAG: DMT family transporter [Paracoccaceae bacterium]